MTRDDAAETSGQVEAQIGKPTEKQARFWLNSQIPYRNFAGHSEALDRVVEQWVSNNRQRFYSQMSSQMDIWATNLAAANGEALWLEHEDDVHIPETKKAIDMKVARIEEGLLDFDPIIQVESVQGGMHRYKAMIITSFLSRMMELAGFRELIQPAARDADLCNIAAVKVIWELLVDYSVDRNVELRYRKDGTPYYDIRRKISKRIVKNGPVYKMVDPFWFFYDLQAGSIQDCEYVGDESEMFLHEIEAKARLGWFSKKKVEELKKRKTSPHSADSAERNASMPDMLRRARMVARLDGGSVEKGPHNAQRVRMVECWGWMDFQDGFDGVTDPLGRRLTGSHRVTATLANGICVRFSLNPYDRKFVPYGVARINRNGHEMAAPAPFNQVVQLNAQYDQAQSDIRRSMRLSVAPIVVTRGDTDLPDSLLNVMPGSVLHATGDWDIVKVPEPSTNSVSYTHSYFRREIEEAAGALRVHESPQNTATETERKVQEQQRMVRNSIRAAGELWRQVGLITYWMCGQFLYQPQRFAVVGKAAQILGKTATITPDILQEDIDLRFVGISSMHTLGNRRYGIMRWTNAFGSMLMAMPDVDIQALAKLALEEEVGLAATEVIFKSAPPPWETMPQDQENEMLLAGHPVAVSINDDDENHIRKILPLLTRKDLPDYIRKLLADHMVAHMEQAEHKAVQRASQMRAAEEKNGMLQAAGGVPGVDKPPDPGGMEAGRKNVTNGPPQERTISRTGRTPSGVSQFEGASPQ